MGFKWSIIPILILTISCGCTRGSSESTSANPNPSFGNNQISISVPSGDILVVVGEQIQLTPIVSNATSEHFSISPDLPVGLDLNPLTGEVTGIAAVIQGRTRYSLKVIDTQGRSSQTSIFIETRPDIYVNNVSIPEVTSVSGPAVNLNQFVSGGKGNYQFEIIDPSFGSVTSLGVFTPGTKQGDVQFKVTDNFGFGTQARFFIHIGVPRIAVNYSNPTEGSPLVLQIDISGKSDVPIAVSYEITLVSAMSDNVSQTPGTVIIPAGSTSAQIQIPTYNNHINKDNGVFTVSLTLDANARFKDTDADTKDYSVIVINVNPAPLVQFLTGSSTAIEYDQLASITINLVGKDGLPLASTKTVSVDYILDPTFTTVQSFDHNFKNGTAIFQPGESSKTIEFQLYHDVNGNLPADNDRLMSFKLLNPINATLGLISRHNLAVLDPMVFDISGTVYDFVLSDELVGRAWNGVQNVLVRIGPNGVLKSSVSTKAAFSSGYVQLTYPTAITLRNEGMIIGHGGLPGSAPNPQSGQYAGLCNKQISGQNGGDGGPAISVVTPLTLVNSGQIYGGGGGGGSGVSAIIGNDAVCSLSKTRIQGGSGGIGADTGTGLPLLPGPGGLPQSSSEADSAYVSAGGSGGVPGLPGAAGDLPALVDVGIIPGQGGLAGLAILDPDTQGGHLVTIQSNSGLIKGR